MKIIKKKNERQATKVLITQLRSMKLSELEKKRLARKPLRDIMAQMQTINNNNTTKEHAVKIKQEYCERLKDIHREWPYH